MTDKEKLETIRAEIHRLVDVRGYDREMANDLFAFMNSLPNEPVSEELEEAVNAYIGYAPDIDECSSVYGKRQAFKAGAKWQKEKEYTCYEEAFEEGAKWKKEHLWKPADGEDLPEIEREVIVLVDNFGKLIPKLAKRTYHLIESFVDEDTGEIISIENTDKVGDIINWTEPAIYWLDADLPKLEED